MISEINLLVCLLVALTGSSQTRDHSSALPRLLSTSHTGRSSSPHAGVPWTEVLKQTHRPAGRDEVSAHTTAFTKTKETVDSQTNAITKSSAVAASLPTFVPDVTTAPPATPTTSDDLSSAPTVQRTTPPRQLSTVDRALLTGDPLTAYSWQPAHTEQDTRSALNASTFEPQSEFLTTVNRAQPTTTEYPLTSGAGWSPAEPTRLEVPSQLNVGDEDIKPRLHSSSPLDPLLAGLLSVFIVATAIILIVLLLKFRQRTNHPEFHRLQDLPMDDLLEDTPLSRYTY